MRLLMVIVLIAAPLAAQTARFEVAAVRSKGTPDALPLISVEPGGRVTAPNSTLRELICAAYALEDNRILGGPEWMARERFAVEAKAVDPAADNEQLRAMLATLLAERFELTAHRETRQLPVYALTLARGDGRLGPQIRRAGTECAPIVPPAGVPPPPPPPPPGSTRRALAPVNVGFRCPVLFFPGWIAGRAVTMDQFATRLATLVDRPVIDGTGLSGEFDFDLAYTPERPPILNGAALPPTADGASVFTAIREQLGLALDARRAPLEVLVIDGVERPSGN